MGRVTVRSKIPSGNLSVQSPPSLRGVCLSRSRPVRRQDLCWLSGKFPTDDRADGPDGPHEPEQNAGGERTGLEDLEGSAAKVAHGVGGPRDGAAGIRHHNAYERARQSHIEDALHLSPSPRDRTSGAIDRPPAPLDGGFGSCSLHERKVS